MSCEFLTSMLELPLRDTSTPPFSEEILQSTFREPDKSGIKLAETSLLEPGEIEINSPFTRVVPSSLVNSSLTESLVEP